MELSNMPNNVERGPLLAEDRAPQVQYASHPPPQRHRGGCFDSCGSCMNSSVQYCHERSWPKYVGIWCCGALTIGSIQFCVTFLALIMVVSSIFSGFAQPPPNIIIPKSALLEFSWAGQSITPTPGGAFSKLFGPPSLSMLELLESLKEAENDNRVKGLIVRFSQPELSTAHIQEVRDALKKLSVKGKPTIAYMDDIDSLRTYYLASGFSSIVLSPTATVSVPGLILESLFFKGTADWASVLFTVFKVGEFKGAVEPLVRSDYSPAVRENLQTLLTDLLKQMTADIAADRKLTQESVERIVDAGVYLSAARAVELGLADKLAYPDQLNDHVLQTLGSHSEPFPLAKYALLDDGRKPPPSAVGLVYAEGTITGGEEGAMGNDLAADSFIKNLQKAVTNKRVRSVVVRIESPGGSAQASDLMWRAIRLAREKYAKPIVVSMGAVAASGGYYMAVAGDKIVADRATITGSIGVFGVRPIFTPATLDKLGHVSSDRVVAGANATVLSSLVEMSPEQVAVFQQSVEEIYEQFTSVVSKGRPMSQARVKELGGGRVYTGGQAQANQLVDKIGGLMDAVEMAKSLAGVPLDVPVDVREYPGPSPLSRFFEELNNRAAPVDFDDDDDDNRASTSSFSPFASPLASLPGLDFLRTLLSSVSQSLQRFSHLLSMAQQMLAQLEQLRAADHKVNMQMGLNWGQAMP